ncbi:Z1 domain-containing protein [Cryptosporangium minutisporangium]|uniref:Z1 domain-containing protein n=1 Tax=Cryptosporangium minutisporangium TaxID=113569 RepID=A0ABP6SWQ9_9ACTN
MDDALFETFLDVVYRRGRDLAADRFRQMHPEAADAVIAEYDRRITQVKNGYPPKILAAPGRRDDGWYAGPQPNDAFWPPFKKFLLHDKAWPESRVDELNEVSSKIIGFGDNPAEPRFTTKGLVVGHVQSGKTTNFTAVVGKAADVGFRVVIILSGIHNGLRMQTQQRLKRELFDLNQGGWIEMTDVERDFQRPTQKAVSLLQPNGQKVAVFVVKKWHTVLTKLITWLKAARPVLANIPALIVDDEADQASVDTKQINPKILELLSLFPRATYLGYTATPFANVLIDPNADDLYPESFIVSLPRQQGYFGAESIFGRDAAEGEARGAELDGYDMVRIIGDDEVPSLRPATRAAAVGFAPDLTDSLRDAVRYFWLATAVRRLRRDSGHSTMLVHTSMTTAVHEAFRPVLEGFRSRVLTGLTAFDQTLLDSLAKQWQDEQGRVPLGGYPHVDFDTLLPVLRQVVQDTTIVLDNCRSKDRLNYSGPPVTAIAVGGNTLSRGLTLEGLVASFFVRSASTYDTLLQMGRWFGYRPGYEDLPRIWMTQRLRSWFRHLAVVEHEIRLDIERYEEQDLSPRDVGVRIRTHPVLNVTAKMGAARIAYASYGGRRVQTRYFREHDEKWLYENLQAGRDLVQAAINDGAAVEVAGGEVLLREVDVEHVLAFLKSYHVHEDSPDLNDALITKYIRKENRQSDPALLSWSVAVVGSPPDTDEKHLVTFASGVVVGTVNRSKLKDTGGDKADIKTLMSKEHRVIDLDIPPATARRMAEADLMVSRDRDPRHRMQGLLLLYPIAKDSPPDEGNEQTRDPLQAVEHVLGMALVFPGTADDWVPNVSYIAVNPQDQPTDAEDAEEERAALSEDEA